MKDLSQLMAIAAMMGGAPGLKRRKAKETRPPKKYRKESEAERRARQAKK